MTSPSFPVYLLPVFECDTCLTRMALLRCRELQAAMLVLRVVPTTEGQHPCSGILDRREATGWVVRPVLESDLGHASHLPARDNELVHVAPVLDAMVILQTSLTNQPKNENPLNGPVTTVAIVSMCFATRTTCVNSLLQQEQHG